MLLYLPDLGQKIQKPIISDYSATESESIWKIYTKKIKYDTL